MSGFSWAKFSQAPLILLTVAFAESAIATKGMLFFYHDLYLKQVLNIVPAMHIHLSFL